MAQIGLAIKGIIAFAKINAFNAFIVNTALSVGMSLVSQALSKRQQSGNNGGITVNRPTVGDTTPANIVFGYYATPGNFTAPPYTRGRSGDTPNAFLTTILDVSDVPIKGFKPIIWIGEDRVELEESAEADSHYAGRMIPVTGSKYRGHIWVKFYDGTQTVVDPHMIATAAGTPRPWSENMIGRGIAYAIIHTKYNSELFSSEPDFLFEVEGALLYDPRKDSTNGGSGPHRYGIVNTYEYTENPIVMIYNIMRGIPLPDGSTWGGRAEKEDLPNSTWFAAMNKCDIPRPGDGLPTYRAGFNTLIGPEEFQGHEPAGVIEELMTACAATIAEIEGGVWGIRVGAPDLPVAFITDDDIIISENEFFDPFPGIEEIINGVQSQYPSIEERWVSKQAPTRYSLAFETEDRGRRNLANVSMPAVTDLTQVQMLQKAFVEDARRFRRHEITLPPDFAHITPLDSIGWNSDRYGYINNKTFEIAAKAMNSKSLNSRMTMRERDSGDFAWQVSDKLPSVVNSPAPIEIETQYGVPGEHWAAYIITDAAGNPRRPGAVLTWAMDGVADVIGISWQVRPLGSTALVNTGTTQDVRGGRQIMSEGFTAGGHYEGRAKVEAPGRRTDWGQWSTFLVDDIRLGFDDIAADIIQDLEDLKTGLDEAFDDVEENRQQIDAIIDAATGQAAIVDQRINDLVDDLEQEALAIRGEIVNARNDIGDDLTDLATTLRGEIGPAVTSGIQDYDIAVQGQFDAMVGQIQQLTAMLASLELLQDGNFVASITDPAETPWTLIGTTSFENTSASGWAAAVTCPEPAFVRLSPDGAIKQRTSEFNVSGGEIFSVRFLGNAAAGNNAYRDLVITAEWFDALGVPIGTPEAVTINLTQDVWGIYSHEFNPPDDAITADITFSRVDPAGNNIFLTGIKANTINKSLEAEITELQGAIANMQGSFATFVTNANVRMGNAETNITNEVAARAAADNAIGVRIGLVETDVDNNKSTIATHETAITNANNAIASVETDIRSQFGVTQLVRDPDFFRGTVYWGIPTPANLIDRNKSSADWWLRDMPGRKAYGFTGNQSTSQWISTVLQGDFAPGEKFDVGYFAGRSSTTAPGVELILRFLNASGGSIQDVRFSPASQTPAVGSYSYHALGGVVAPPGTASASIHTRRNGGSGLATDRTYVTMFTVKKWAAGDALSDSRIQTISDTVADDVAALAAYKTTVNTRFNGNETAISNEITNRTNADNALGGRIDTLTGRVGANETNISNVQTALVNTNEAIGQVEFNLTTQFGMAQKVRDPEFADGLEHWPNGTLGAAANIITRDYSNSHWLINSMPGKKAFRMNWNPDGKRYSNTFEIDPYGVYDLAFYVGRLGSGGPGYTVAVEWLAANDPNSTVVSTSELVNARPPAGAYHHFVLPELSPPAGARAGRLAFYRGGGGNTADWSYLTRLTLTERGAFERATQADINESFLAIAGVDNALTAYKNSNNTRVGLAEGKINTEITNRTNADNALTSQLNTLSGRVGQNETDISNAETTLTTHDVAIADVTQRVSSTFGKTQVVRDPDFSSGLTFWGGAMGDATRLYARNPNGNHWMRETMPGKFAFAILANDTGGRVSPMFDVSPAETYDFGMYVGNEANAPSVNFGIQWFDKTGAQISTAASLTNLTSLGKYTFFSQEGVKPPSDALQGRFYFARGQNGSSGTARMWVTGAEVNRQRPGDVVTNALVKQTSQTVANIESAQSAYEVATNASFGRITAGNRLRAYSLAAFSGGISRVALTAEAAGASAATAGIFLEAKSDGTSAVYIDANRFAFVNGPTNGATRTTPFFIEGGKTYIASAVIKEATIDTLHLGVGAAVSGVSASYDVTHSDPNGYTTRNLTVPVYSTNSRLLLVFDGIIYPGNYSGGAGSFAGSIQFAHNGIVKPVASSRSWTYIYGDGLTATGHAQEVVSHVATATPTVAGNNTIQLRIRGRYAGNVTVLDVRKSR